MNSYIEPDPDLTLVLSIMKDKLLVVELPVGKGKFISASCNVRILLTMNPF